MVTNQLRVAGHLIDKNIVMGVKKEKKKIKNRFKGEM